MQSRFLEQVGGERQASPNVPSASPIFKTKLENPPKDLKPSTLYETFMNSVEKFPNNECECECACTQSCAAASCLGYQTCLCLCHCQCAVMCVCIHA